MQVGLKSAPWRTSQTLFCCLLRVLSCSQPESVLCRHAGDNSMDHRRAAGSYPTAAAPSSAVGAAPPGSDALTPHAFTPTLTGLTAPLGGVSSPPDADALLPASHYTLMGPKVVKRLTGFFDGPVTGVCPEQLCLDTGESAAPNPPHTSPPLHPPYPPCRTSPPPPVYCLRGPSDFPGHSGTFTSPVHMHACC